MQGTRGHEASPQADTTGTRGLAGWRILLNAPPCGQKSQDWAQSEPDAHHPSAEAECAAARDLDPWDPRTTDTEQLTFQVRPRSLLQEVQHIINGTRTMPDVIFYHQGGRNAPFLTLEQPSQWRYVAMLLMAHVGAHTPDDLNCLHWRWHHRAALRIRVALCRHIICMIQTPHPRGQASQTGPRGISASGLQEPGSPKASTTLQPLAAPTRATIRRELSLQPVTEPPLALPPPTAGRTAARTPQEWEPHGKPLRH